MALDIVKLYISLFSEFFVLSDIAVISSSTSEKIPPLLPIHSNSLTSAHFIIKILIEVQDCVNEVSAMEIVREAGTSLKSLMENVRWKLDEVLVRTWLRGSILPLLDDRG